MPNLLICYLSAKDIINLYHVSKIYKQTILKKFLQIFNISTGFCSADQWNLLIQKFCFYLIEDLLCQQYFDQNFFNYHFDFDENYSGLLKEFRHLSLFSVCLHFLRCITSCDIKMNIPFHCKLCSRVFDHNFAPCNSYGNLLITFSSSVLDLSHDHRIDLDVFLSNAYIILKNYTKNNGECLFFQSFEYAEDVFCAFSSILIRVYLNITLPFFSWILTNIRDLKKIVDIIVKHGHFLLSKFWNEVNIDYIYELFDLFDTVYLSFCYQNIVTKPEFGPYHGPSDLITLKVIRF